MGGFVIVVRLDGPDELKGGEITRMVTKALARIETKAIRVKAKEGPYREEDWDAYQRSRNPRGRAIRKIAVTKKEASTDGSS